MTHLCFLFFLKTSTSIDKKNDYWLKTAYILANNHLLVTTTTTIEFGSSLPYHSATWSCWRSYLHRGKWHREEGTVSVSSWDVKVWRCSLPKEVDSSEGKREVSCMESWVESMNTFTPSHLLFPSAFFTKGFSEYGTDWLNIRNNSCV